MAVVGLALVFYALALFSKTTACTLPAALLLILWLKEKRIGWLRLAQVVPFLAMGFGMGLLAIWWERFHQGTQGKFFSLGWLERVLVASRAVWFYAGKLVWPSNLTFSYPRWTINPADPFAYGWLVAGVGLCVAIFFVRRFVGRSVEVAALFFVVTLSPLLGFIMLYTFRYSFVADHYQYAACIGFFALAAAGITAAFGFFWKKNQLLKPLFYGVLLLTLGGLTWRQCGMYANFETLMQATIQRNPDSAMAHNNLGNILLRKGRVEDAIIHLQTALKIDPDYAEPHANLGSALFQNGQIDEALIEYQKSVEINPNFAGSQFNLGMTLFQKGRVDEAITHYQRAVELSPNFPGSQFNLGSAFLQKGQVDEAIIYFQKALEINPNYPEAYNSLGFALYKKGRVDEAIESAQQALQLATAQNNASLVDAIQKQIEFYHASPSLNDDSLTNTPAHSSHP